MKMIVVDMMVMVECECVWCGGDDGGRDGVCMVCTCVCVWW